MRQRPPPPPVDRGLVITSPWIDKILAGEKTWEIRSRASRRAGWIALCRKGGWIAGTCRIEMSIPLSRKEFARHFDKHRVDLKTLTRFYGSKPVHAWPLSDVRRIDPPIPFKNPGGSSWVKLSRGMRGSLMAPNS